MLHYPPQVTEICKHCGASATLERQGDGHPGGGTLHYWYTTDHRCPESERVIAEYGSERRWLEEMLYGGSS